MADHSAIEWTDATWNPTRGCTKVSPGCAHCYIERTPPFRIAGNRFINGKTDLEIFHDRLEQPLHWKKPRRVFVNSLSDLFHEDIGEAFIDSVFATMALTPRHTYQVLTKRPERMRDVVSGLAPQHTAPDGSGWPLPNVWLGVSVENQHFADERIPLLLHTPAAIRFISAEPLLGPVDLNHVFLREGVTGWGPRRRAVDALTGWEDDYPPMARAPRESMATARHLDWVIVGVEQLAGGRVGRNADGYSEHARAVLQQCRAAGVATFHKQMPVSDRVSGDPAEWPADLRVREYPVSA